MLDQGIAMGRVGVLPTGTAKVCGPQCHGFAWQEDGVDAIRQSVLVRKSKSEVTRTDQFVPTLNRGGARPLIRELISSEVQEHESRRNVYDGVQKIQEGESVRILVIGAKPGECGMYSQVALGLFETLANEFPALRARSGGR
jgi:hypothetical protein